jgi:Family of unknown function (DUF6510)
MDALDGNAIAGLMQEVFGTEMTTVTGMCVTCGAAAPLAECVVYLRAPGTVARCHNCGSVVMVITTIRDMNCVDLRGFTSLAASS